MPLFASLISGQGSLHLKPDLLGGFDTLVGPMAVQVSDEAAKILRAAYPDVVRVTFTTVDTAAVAAEAAVNAGEASAVAATRRLEDLLNKAEQTVRDATARSEEILAKANAQAKAIVEAAPAKAEKAVAAGAVDAVKKAEGK